MLRGGVQQRVSSCVLRQGTTRGGGADPLMLASVNACKRLMLASVGIGHQNSPLFAMYLSVGADGGGYTISVPIKMRYLLRRGRQIWRPPSWGVRSTCRLGHERIQIRAMPFTVVRCFIGAI